MKKSELEIRLQSLDITRTAVAKAAGVSAVSVTNVLKGRYKSTKVIAMIAEMIGWTPAQVQAFIPTRTTQKGGK